MHPAAMPPIQRFASASIPRSDGLRLLGAADGPPHPLSMSDWASLESSVNAVMIATFGVPATFTPQDGSGGWLAPQAILGVVMRPAMAEDFPPGFGGGTANLRLWVNFETITPAPRHGDQIVFNGITYLVAEVEADIGGSAVLKLRTT